MEDGAELPVTICSLTINFSPPRNAYSSYMGQHTHILYAWTKKRTQTHVGTNKSASLYYPEV